MILSKEFPLTFRGAAATLTVVRNNGFCWGEIHVQDDERFSVSTRHDWYEYPDEDAAAAFIRASRNPRCVEASLLS